MANWVVRNLDQRIVNSLKLQAAKHEHSTETKHRAILKSALLGPAKKTFAEVLSSIAFGRQHKNDKCKH